ncbi:MAG: F0F1 ATP synthase subunit B, partial [Blastococcus sp.]
LASQRQQVVNELRGQIGALAVELAGRVVGESLADDARRSGTVDNFLAELDEMAPSGDGAR